MEQESSVISLNKQALKIYHNRRIISSTGLAAQVLVDHLLNQQNHHQISS